MSFHWTTVWVGLAALAPFAWSQQPQLHREIPEDAFGTRELEYRLLRWRKAHSLSWVAPN